MPHIIRGDIFRNRFHQIDSQPIALVDFFVLIHLLPGQRFVGVGIQAIVAGVDGQIIRREAHHGERVVFDGEGITFEFGITIEQFGEGKLSVSHIEHLQHIAFLIAGFAHHHQIAHIALGKRGFGAVEFGIVGLHTAAKIGITVIGREIRHGETEAGAIPHRAANGVHLHGFRLHKEIIHGVDFLRAIEVSHNKIVNFLCGVGFTCQGGFGATQFRVLDIGNHTLHTGERLAQVLLAHIPRVGQCE